MTFIYIILTILVLTALLGLSSLAVRKKKLSPEAARKSVHFGMGITCMFFPWIFDSVLAVQMLGIISVSTIILVRMSPLKNSFGSSLFSVSRLSIGELLFPIAVAWLFTLNFNDGGKLTVLYVIPLLLLTLADTAGAIAGTRFGKIIYQSSHGKKSVEGSVAFFTVAFICTLVPLLLFSPFTFYHILYLSITVSLFITAVEGASGMGMDNLLIPLGAYFLLDHHQEFSTISLWYRAVTLIALIALLVFTHKKHSLNGAALLTAALLCFTSSMLGGIYCLIACMFIYARNIYAARGIPTHLEHRHSIDAVISISAPAITWLILLPEGENSVLFIASLAITIAMLHVGTCKYKGSTKLICSNLCNAASLATAISLLTIPHAHSFTSAMIICLSILLVTVITSSLFFYVRSTHASSLNDWVALSTIVSFSTYLLYRYYDNYHFCI